MDKTKVNCSKLRHCKQKVTRYSKAHDQYCSSVISAIFWCALPPCAVFYLSDTNLIGLAKVSVITICLVMFLHLPFLIFCYLKLQLAHELKRNGVTAQGFILDKWEVKKMGEGGENDFYYLYNIGYQFIVDGRFWFGSNEVTKPLYDKLQIGNNIAIRFLPRDPNISLLE